MRPVSKTVRYLQKKPRQSLDGGEQYLKRSNFGPEPHPQGVSSGPSFVVSHPEQVTTGNAPDADCSDTNSPFTYRRHVSVPVSSLPIAEM